MYDAIFEFFGLFCHQLPERSFLVFGAQFPLCIRCSALLGGAVGAVVYLFMRLPLPPVKLSVAMALPLALEMGAASMGLVVSTNLVRGVTGVLFGFSSLFLAGSIPGLAGRESGRRRSNSLSRSRDLEAS
jgi:uncharacterized membrane protein